MVREVANGQYANVPKAVYRFEVADSRGRLIVARPVTLSEFGTFHESLPLDSARAAGHVSRHGLPAGQERLLGRVSRSSRTSSSRSTWASTSKKTVVYRGETVAGRRDRALPVRRAAGVAADRGRPARRPHPARDDRRRRQVSRRVLDRGIRRGAGAPARRPAAAGQRGRGGHGACSRSAASRSALSTTRDVYLDGESFPLQVVTTDAQGKPIGESLSAALVKQVTHATAASPSARSRARPVTTDPKTGRGSLTFRVDDAQGGHYHPPRRRAPTGSAPRSSPIERSSISGKKDETKLRLLADRQRYKVGEEASVNLHSRGRAGTALLTWEADRILSYAS